MNEAKREIAMLEAVEMEMLQKSDAEEEAVDMNNANVSRRAANIAREDGDSEENEEGGHEGVNVSVPLADNQVPDFEVFEQYIYSMQ